MSERKNMLVTSFLDEIETDLRHDVQRAVNQIPRLNRFAVARVSELDSVLSALEEFLAAEEQGGEEADAALEKLRRAWGGR